MIWTILGIEETKDKKAITAAFRARLTAVNPEEKPEEFKELRAAYEEALKLADQTEKTDEEKTDVELWTDKLESLFNDLQKRLDLSSWENLFADDLCVALDTRQEVEDAMIRFFMSNYHIPHKVMLYLDKQFGFSDRLEELKEKYPADFVEYIIRNGILYEDNFPLGMFEPGIDGKTADAYEEIFRRAKNTPIEEAGEYYEQMRNSSEKHPYGEALLYKVELENGDETALAGLEALHDKWPEDNHIALDLIYAYVSLNRMEKVIELADACLERNPGLLAAKRYKAEALAQGGRYQDAVELINQLMQDVTGDQGSYYELDALRRKWNESMMDQLNDKLNENPDDAKARYDLMWCLIQNERSEEADAMADKLPEEQPDAFGYYNVKSVLANEAKRYEEALEYLKKLLDTIEHMEPDGTDQTDRRIKRRTEVIGRISAVLFMLGRKDEAIETAERSISEVDPDTASVFNLIGLHLENKNYQRVEELADLILKTDSSNPSALYYKAYTNFQNGRDNAAFEAINDALDRDASALPYYILKIRILIRNNAFEPAEEIIDFLEKNGITEEPSLLYCKVYIFARKNDNVPPEERKQQEYDDILSMADSLDKRLCSEENGNADWTAHFYYLYALLTADRQDFDKEYPVKPIIDILDKGLAADPEYYSCISYKAWLLKKDKQNEESLALYRKLEQLPEHSPAVEHNIAEIFYDDLPNHAGDALEYYKRFIEENPDDPDNYFFAGMCNYRMENTEEAEKCFRQEQQCGPDDIDGYFRLAYVLLKCDRLEEAEEQALKTVELAKKREGNTVRFWMPLIRVYRRMNKPSDAIAAVSECAEHNPDWDSRRIIFDIYIQAGMYSEAKKHVDAWSKQERFKNPRGWNTAKATLLSLTQEYGKLDFHLGDKSQYIEASDLKNARMLLAARKGRLKQYMSFSKNYVKSIKGMNTYDRGNYAWALFVGGETEKAKEEASVAYEELQTEIAQATGNRKMYCSRAVRLLAILGKEEEARQALLEAKAIPTCDMCDYACCKDLAIYEASLEYILGNYDRALEIVQDGEQTWHDDTDFTELMYLIKAKGNR